jgi:hypothetical protein
MYIFYIIPLFYIGNPGPGVGQTQNCDRVKLSNEIQTLLIIGFPTTI